MPKSAARQRPHNFMNNVASQWANNDPKAALAWAANLDAGKERDQAYSAITSSWAQHAPRDAANFVVGLPPGEGQRFRKSGGE